MYGKGKMLSVISIGNMFRECLKAVENLNRRGIQTTLVNARYIKPLDTRIADIIRESGKAIVVEESARLGGFGSAIMELCQEKGVKADIKSIGIPDHFVEQGSQDILRRGCGLYWENVVKTGVKMLGRVPGSNPRGCSGF
jgi:1-deoxy-D-xylulose-5-phosphate synthase